MSGMNEPNQRSVVSNPDNEFLGPTGGGPVTIGLVDEVNGLGAAGVPEFVPTRHELLELARFWAREDLEIQLGWFLYGQTGSTDLRVSSYAIRRINRIADLLGQDVVKDAIASVYREAEERDKLLWKIFKDGDQKEWDVVQHVNHRIVVEHHQASKLKGGAS